MHTRLLNTGLIAFFITCFNFDLGTSVTIVTLGNTATFDCYNPTESVQSGSYIALDFASDNENSFSSVAEYSPSSLQTNIRNKDYETRLTFSNTGKVELQNTIYADEGTYKCEVRGFGVQGTTVTTELSVYESPEVVIELMTKPLVVGNGLVNVSSCSAVNGKPPAQITWRTDRHLEFTQIRSNEIDAANQLTSTVISVLRLDPTKYYNNQEFVCVVTHPTFIEPVQKAIYLNVTYPPGKPVIQADDDLQNLICESDGNPPPTYEWKMPQAAPSATAVGPKVVIISPDDPAHANDTYICIASNGVGEPVSASINNSFALQTYSLNQGNVGVIIGAIVGAIVLIVLILVLGYYVYHRKVKSSIDGGGPHPAARSSLINYKTDGYTRPSIQHANDSLNKQRPPSPAVPPPDDKFDHENRSITSDSDNEEGEHDIDLEDNPTTTLVNPPPYRPPEITSRTSMNYRARRQRPSSASGSRRSRTQMTKPADYHVPTPQESGRYDVPPGDGYDEDGDLASDPHQDPRNYPQYNANNHPDQHPQYLDQPDRQPPRRTDSLPDYEPKYSEIDHSRYQRGDPSRRQHYEEPVEYAQIRNGHSQLV